MSRSTGNTFGLERGKVGDRIAIVLDGKQFYKGLYRPTNPRTPKQQMHRAKLAFANRLASQLVEAANTAGISTLSPDEKKADKNHRNINRRVSPSVFIDTITVGSDN